MFEILAEILSPGLRGGGAGCRVRIKPSWSGRVYGTYSVRGRHFLLAFAFLASTAALCGHLIALNLGEAGQHRELDAWRRANAHQLAMREIAYPARKEALIGRTDELSARAREIERILGINQPSMPAGGVGTMGLLDNYATALEQHDLKHVATETDFLTARYGFLQSELESRQDELRHTPSVVPISDSQFVLTSSYGRRMSPFTRLSELHRGLDLAADMYTRLVATADGTVAAVNRDPRANAMGIYVVIDHAGRYSTYYGHCARILVEEGQAVRRHELIAEVGSTGRSTGPHVHYEIRKNGKSIDPRDFLVLDPRFGEAEYLALN